MEHKSEAFEFFRDLALRLFNLFPGAMKGIRSDNGLEFKNASFADLLADHGIEHQFSTPRTPQQNGVVERKNRTLVEMTRTMLDEYGTSRRYWAEAVSTACYVSNHVSASSSTCDIL